MDFTPDARKGKDTTVLIKLGRVEWFKVRKLADMMGMKPCNFKRGFGSDVPAIYAECSDKEREPATCARQFDRAGRARCHQRHRYGERAASTIAPGTASSGLGPHVDGGRMLCDVSQTPEAYV